MERIKISEIIKETIEKIKKLEIDPHKTNIPDRVVNWIRVRKIIVKSIRGHGMTLEESSIIVAAYNEDPAGYSVHAIFTDPLVVSSYSLLVACDTIQKAIEELNPLANKEI
jgi:hypothetical protein